MQSLTLRFILNKAIVLVLHLFSHVEIWFVMDLRAFSFVPDNLGLLK